MVIYDRRFFLRHTAVAAGVVLIHMAFLAEFLLLSRPGDSVPPAPLHPGMLTIIRPPKPPPPRPPAVFTALAAPRAPFIPPPDILIQQPLLRVASTTVRKAAETEAYSQMAGTGAGLKSGRKVPPTPPVFIGNGTPEYPKGYRNFALNGFVSVTCVVETDGRVDHCRLINVEGGPAFGQAALSWLQNGQYRYKPATRDGQAVAQSAALKFVFVPGAGGSQ